MPDCEFATIVASCMLCLSTAFNSFSEDVRDHFESSAGLSLPSEDEELGGRNLEMRCVESRALRRRVLRASEGSLVFGGRTMPRDLRSSTSSSRDASIVAVKGRERRVKGVLRAMQNGSEKKLKRR